MQDSGCGLPRRLLTRRLVNNGKKKGRGDYATTRQTCSQSLRHVDGAGLMENNRLKLVTFTSKLH